MWSLAQNILLCYPHSPFFLQYEMTRCLHDETKTVNDTGIVTRHEVTTDPLMIHQKEDRLLPGRGCLQVTETTEAKLWIRRDYCTDIQKEGTYHTMEY